MQMTLDFQFQNGSFSFGSGDYQPQLIEDGDFWRAFLDTEEIRELSVYSHAQTPVSVDVQGDETIIRYDRLIAENGECHEIGLTVFIRRMDGALHFSAEIDNRSAVRLNELQLPYFCASRYDCDEQDEVLFAPEMMGRRNPNPRRMMDAVHSEYMGADYKSVTYDRLYPNDMSMPWLCLQTGARCLYIGEHDAEMKQVGLNVHASPRFAPSYLGFSVSHYIAARPGEKLRYGESVLALFEGDWRDASAYYRAWTNRTWYPDPHVRPEWVHQMTGWQRIICKHQYGEIFFRYDDLPRLYEEGKVYGLNTLLVFGWWKGRFDNNYPELEPDPALGGEEGLKEAIRKIKADGGRVLLYSNGNLIDVKTDFYKNTGARICHKDIDGNEYREHYQFSNDGTILKHFGYKTFVTGCHTTPEWQQRLVENARLKHSFGGDSVFFDQLANHVKLCFDDSHPHGARIDREPISRLNNLRAIREQLNPEEAIGIEFVCDRYGEAVDYVHGCGYTCEYYPDSYPDLYLYTFPGTVCTNRYIHDERADYKEYLNFAFASGLIFDVCIFRGRKCGIAGQPNYAAHVKKLLDLKARYAEYFYGGVFQTLYGQLPEGVRGSAFRAKDGADFAAALWNESDHDITFTLAGREITLAAGEVAAELFA